MTKPPPDLTPEEEVALSSLEARLGPLHIRQRLRLERDHEAHVGQTGARFFHGEDWCSIAGLIRGSFRLVGLHERGRRNARDIQVRTHEVTLPNLPGAFDGFTLLQLSDLHVDLTAEFIEALIGRVRPLDYDLCVLTGDYRARTFGPYEAVLIGLERLRTHIKGPAYAVLGNHDTIRLVPRMEAMGYNLLINEPTTIERGGEVIYLAGIDDAHHYRLEDFQRAARGIPSEEVSILLSHTPEAYADAALAGFDLMLCGHTHGGQICLPGGMPLLTEARSSRAFVRGSWRHGEMTGYTSAGTGSCVVDIRLNCPPEITLHRLRRADAR
jgi:uncharacterized protein